MGDPSSVVGALKLVYDLVCGLISGYEREKRNLFVDHVEPLQKHMMNIHKRYVKGFQEVRRHLKDKSLPPIGVIEFLEERRQGDAAERDLAKQLAQKLEDAERRIVRSAAWSALKSYCEAVSGYFLPPAQYARRLTWYSSYLETVRYKVERRTRNVWRDPSIAGISHSGPGEHAREELLKMAEAILNRDLPEAISLVNRHYAELKSKLL